MNGKAQAESLKTKTKAKTRYLKAKKERRKQRKVGTHGVGSNTTLVQEKTIGSDEERDGGSPPLVTETIAIPNETAEPDVRAHKRRRFEPLNNEDAPVEAELDASEAPSSNPPAPPGTLPSFPLPTRPDAPSKSDLALLGLDKALIDAEIVDSTATTPIQVDSHECSTGLTQRTKRRLQEIGINELFAVQTSILPFLLSSNQHYNRSYVPYDPPRDVCVSAPTGSGKTLAYVLPIIEMLASRIVTRLRALVVLPTRDLVSQVRETFEAVGKGRGLKIGSATGQHSFAHEQSQLVADMSSKTRGGSSRVDVLICTPGRLMDHLNGTPNFSLQHLRFLVIDEADRLLAQSFQDWLAQVLAATRASPHTLNIFPTQEVEAPPQPDGMAPAFDHFPEDIVPFKTSFDEPKQPSCQKLLFSATLTRDPGKIAALDLKDPKYFVVQSHDSINPKSALATESFSMPATLSEHMIVCESSKKPLILFHLIRAHEINNALVFTKSAESTNRLVRLLEFFEDSFASDKGDSHRKTKISAYSSDLAPSERKYILERFKAQETDILVCSDLISRGIDISHVSHVVSYDVPVDMRKYVHRVGRTARAGRNGDAWTLVEEQEARYFKFMMKEADHLERLKRLRITENHLLPLLPAYETALDKLKEFYGRY